LFVWILEQKPKLTKLAQVEGKNTSQVVRELIENYIQKPDMSSYVDDLWIESARKIVD